MFLGFGEIWCFFGLSQRPFSFVFQIFSREQIQAPLFVGVHGICSLGCPFFVEFS